MGAPLVSVCIPAYNAASTIERTIASVVAQGVSDVEIVVSDNASVDDTVAIAERSGHPFVRVIRQPRNLGMVRNYEAVLAASRGTYVKLLCADDTLYPGGLAREVAALSAAPASVVVAVARRDVSVAGRGRLPRAPILRRGDRLETGPALQRRIITTGRNLLGEGQAVLVRGDVIRSAAARGLGDPYVVDLSLWFHVLTAGDAIHLPHLHGTFSVSRAAASWDLRDRQHEEVAQFLKSSARHLGVGPIARRRGLVRASLGRRLRRLVYRASSGRVGSRS